MLEYPLARVRKGQTEIRGVRGAGELRGVPQAQRIGRADATHGGAVEFHEENETPVVGIREGSMLRVEKGTTVLKGTTGAKIFRRGETPIEIPPRAVVDPFAESRSK